MRFIPIKTRYKKQQKGKLSNRVSSLLNLNKLHTGTIGLKSSSSGRITAKQLIAFRSTVLKFIKKLGRLNMNIVADIPISKKPLEVRMGKGKGNVDHWVCKIKYGTILCTLEVKKISIALLALKNGQIRLPIKTKIFWN
jgi:large subunit ribosomal protein L16